MRRAYFDLVLADGRNTVVFCDRRRGRWYAQRACPPSSFTPTPATRSWTAPPSPTSWPSRAAELGYDAFALTDHDGLSGSLEFAHAARDAGVRPITGCELTLDGGAHLTLLVETQAGYRNLCRLLTLAHADDRRAPAATLEQVARHADGLHCLSGCARDGAGRAAGRRGPARRGRGRRPARLRGIFGRDRFSIELQRPYWRGDARRNRLLGGAGRPAAPAHGRHRRRPRPQRPPRASSRTPWSRSASTPRSRPASADRRGNHESVLRAPAEMAARFPAEAVRGGGGGGRPLPLRPHAATSATATPTSSPTPASRPPRRPAPHLPRRARAPLRRPPPPARGPARGWRRSWA